MFLSLNWLKDFVDIPKFITPEQVGLKLTISSEVGLPTVRIIKIKKYQNYDKYEKSLNYRRNRCFR
ncbi:MAG: hypothetical protein AAB526_00540 [Patescibacteria group bacterium]